MGNPSLRSDPLAPTGPSHRPDNGVLGFVGGDFIAQGSLTLPKAGPEHGKGAVREVVVQGVPRFGLVRMTYENHSHKHRRNRLWSWRPVRADAVTLALPVVSYPRWVNDFYWPAA